MAASSSERRIPRTADPDQLRAAIAERVAFDGVTVDLPPSEETIVVRWDGAVPDDIDWIVAQIRALDADLAVKLSLRLLPEEDLMAQLEQKQPLARAVENAGGGYEYLLLEAVCRGGHPWNSWIAARLASREQSRNLGDVHDVELLTALRRIEGKPDPVRLELSPPATTTYPDLPRVTGRFVNRDDRSVEMTRGGNYRSGRMSRWHVEVRDARGRLMPLVDWKAGEEGGMYTRGPLAPGGTFDASVRLCSYVEPLPPGEYRVFVHYHDSALIAYPEAYPGHVTLDAEPFPLRVMPRVVETTRAEDERLEALAAALPRSGTVPLLSDPYGPWAHDVIAPDSAAGQLLSAGWKAVPHLLRVAASDDAEPKRRAWALALLVPISDAFNSRLYLSAVGTCSSYFRDGERSMSTFGSSVERIDATLQTSTAAQCAKIAAGVEFRHAQ